MNKIKYEKRMKELDQIAEEQQLRQQVRDRERELGLRRTRKKPAWGKAMMAVVYGLCIEIVIYAEVVMWMRFDLSALYALIGVPAAMFGVFWAYAQKSAKENTKGGIVYAHLFPSKQIEIGLWGKRHARHLKEHYKVDW